MSKESHEHKALGFGKMEVDSISEQGFINYISNSAPSLQDTTILKIVITLWKQHNLHYDKQKCPYIRGNGEKTSQFHQMAEQISIKVSCLPLPVKIQSKLSNVIEPIGFQILSWSMYNNTGYSWYHNSDKYMDSIHWTVEGTINKTATLEKILNDRDSKVYTSEIYNLACKYCLEGHIFNLWDKMALKTKESQFYCEDIFHRSDCYLIAYWTSSIKNELSKLSGKIKWYEGPDIYDITRSLHENMFALSIDCGNVLAMKYFWPKLSDEEKSDNIFKWTEDVITFKEERLTMQHQYRSTNDYVDILCFLLSELNDKEQQRQVFEKNSEVILESLFTHWPWQHKLLPTIQEMWDYLEEDAYVSLVEQVIKNITPGKTTVNLLQEIWYITPLKFKIGFLQYILCYDYSSYKTWNLLQIADVETILLILDIATLEDRKRIIFVTIEIEKDMFEVFHVNKLQLLEVVISKALCLECEIIRFKKEVMEKLGNRFCCDWICKNNWQATEDFLYWGFTSEEEIYKFKRKSIYRVMNSIMAISNYKLMDTFLHWCCCSEEEINQLKKEAAIF